jgi:hypothetical protein
MFNILLAMRNCGWMKWGSWAPSENLNCKPFLTRNQLPKSAVLLFSDGAWNLRADRRTDPGRSLIPHQVQGGKTFFEAKKLQLEGAKVKTIHKYSLDTTREDRITVMMPLVAKIVMVGSQNGQPFLWAIVNSESPLIERHYRLIATGQPIPGGYDHVASFTRNNGESTWHLFE